MKRALVLLVVAACGSKSDTKKQPQPPLSTKLAQQAKDLPDGIDIRLSDGKQGPPPFDHNKLAAAKKLGDADVQQLLARAKPLETDPDDSKDFALRPMSQPPPRTGNTIKDTFPAAVTMPPPPTAANANKDLEVLRFMPEGEIPYAPELSVTFNQPMVAVTSQDDAAKVQPVKLDPQPKGKWRWIGTRTILFDPDPRFPQSTTYKITIPEGTKSATGQTLKKAVSFSFETPAPKLVAQFPYSGAPQHLDVPMFVMFDQRIDPQSVLSKIKVTVPGPAKQQQQQPQQKPNPLKPQIKKQDTPDPWAAGATPSGSHTVGLKLLSDAEIQKNNTLKNLVEGASKDENNKHKWLAFRATEEFPPNASITVEIPEGTPSAEGPNKTKQSQSFSFSTYPPLQVISTSCDYNRDQCPPSVPLAMYFNNPIDADKFDEKLVTFSPEIEHSQIVQSGSMVAVYGFTKSRTTYKMTIGGGIIDEFGQKLGHDETRTFTIGDAAPTFYGPSGMVVVDPQGQKPTLDFFSTNYESLKVRIYKVTPGNLRGYYTYLENLWNKDHPPTPPGTKVFDQLVTTGGKQNELVETHVDLAVAMNKAGLGHAIVIVEPHPWNQEWDPPRMISWVQSTKLAVDAHVDGDHLVAFTTELSSGKPLSGIDVELAPTGTHGTSDDKGLASIPLPSGQQSTNVLYARRGDDTALLLENEGYWSGYGSWYRQGRDKQLAWYVVDDRKLYKPGEEVSLKGWLRTIDYGKGGDVGGQPDAIKTITYTVTDAVGNQIGKGSMQVSPVGGFDTKFTLPKTPNLGYANVSMQTVGYPGYYSHSFQLQEFRRPEFEVSAQASTGPFSIGEGGDITVSAKYFAGGALPGAEVNWYVNASQTSFTPPNRDDFTFGQWTPWWGYRSWYDDTSNDYKPQPSWNWHGKTDALGEHVLHMDFLSAKPSLPYSVTANASVMDVNRQQWNASTSLIVHPSSRYVGVKVQRPYVEKGTPFDLEVIGVDIDGKATPGAKIEVKTVRLDYEYKRGRYQTKEVDPQTCMVTAAKDPSPCEFKTDKGGTYQVTATIVDDKGRANTTKLTYWVSGGDNPPARDVAMEQVQLIPDKKEYSAGNTAEILVQAPFYPAEGIVTWRRSGIVKTERISITGPTASLKVPITEDLVPNLYVQVDLVGMQLRTDDAGVPDPKLPKRPAYAAGSIDLPIPPKQRTLTVDVTPSAEKLGPGEETSLALVVKDAQGKPVADAEAAVIVVDEAILSLTGYQFPNPVDSFYPQRGPDTRDYYQRAYVKLARPDLTKAQGNMPMPGGGGSFRDRGGVEEGDFEMAKQSALYDEKPMDMPPVAAAAPAAEPMMKKAESKSTFSPKPAPPAKTMTSTGSRIAVGGKDKADAISLARNQGVLGSVATTPTTQPQPNTPVTVRTNFNPLAAFSPTVKTDASGKATVTVKMPDNLTRYRVVAIAVAGNKQYGKGESAITARLPLMVRPSPPRFLNFGDSFQMPVVVQNQTDKPLTVRIAARTANMSLTDGAGREFMVPPNDRVEVQLPAAAEMAGTARFQVIAAAGDASDAADLELPVWTPATTEAFATYGVIDEGAMAQPVALPGKVWPQFGGLEVTTASTNLQSLTDAVIYLVKYPFDCAEQRSSRILALASLRDVLAAFKSKDLPSTAAMEHSVDIDVEHLTQMQNWDGGFVYWERGHPSEPYLSVFVMQALYKAKSHGYTVPAQMTTRGLQFLRNIEGYYPYWYDADIRHAISAYALYVRKQHGDLDIAKAKALYAELGKLDTASMETLGWLLSTFAGNAGAAKERQEIVRYAINHVSETAGAANFTTGYGDGKYLLLASDRRTDGVMLEALILEDPKNDLIPKIVTGLLAHRTKGHWLNTQENAFVLTALE
ncbi:MAG TPA: alpha-2-macroglobulin family protein, partial [Kofleriaceae bacterium]|nr:alpha-2-macroglobulin family protein [Kofleriaceae bacterium]